MRQRAEHDVDTDGVQRALLVRRARARSSPGEVFAMTQQMQRPVEAPRRIGPTWIEGLSIVALAVAIVVLRAIGTLPPDATSPMAPWLLDALRTGVDPIGR